MSEIARIPLQQIVPLGRGQLTTNDNGVLLVTGPEQWEFSAEAKFAVPGSEHQPRIVQIHVTVESGVLGVGWLREDGSGWVTRASAPATTEGPLRLLLPAHTLGGKLIFENWTVGNELARATIRRIGIQLPELGLVEVHESAKLIADTPITIETGPALWSYACWRSLAVGGIEVGRAGVSGLDLVVIRGAVSVCTLTPDEKIIFECHPLSPLPLRQPYHVRIAQHLLIGADRILIRNVSDNGSSQFEIHGWHQVQVLTPAHEGVEKRVAAELAASAAIGFRRLLSHGSMAGTQQSAGLNDIYGLALALGTALDRRFPDIYYLRAARFIRDAVSDRFPESRCVIVLPFDPSDAADKAAYWLTADIIAREMLTGRLAGDVICSSIARERGCGSAVPDIDFVLLLDKALAQIVLLSERDMRSLSRVTRKGIALTVAVSDQLVGSNCWSDETKELTLSGDSVRSLLHQVGFYDVAIVTRAGQGSIDLEASAISRAHLGGYAALVERGAYVSENHSLPMASPLILATHGPMIACVEL